MAHKKAGGTAKNLSKTNPRYLGVKLSGGQAARVGNVIVRQRGACYLAGPGTAMGRDHTIFALVAGTVAFTDKRKTRFDGEILRKKLVSVA